METISTLTYLSMQLVKVLDIRKIKSNCNNYIQAQFRTGTQWGISVPAVIVLARLWTEASYAKFGKSLISD